MKHLDLFSGIGGFALAAEWVWGDDHEVLAFCDIDKYATKVLSQAGKRKGKDDDRYLWPEMLRIIADVRPRWVVGENVSGIYSIEQGMVFEQVCADLEAAGYEVWPLRIPASAVNAPHRRDRWWFVAHTQHNGRDGSLPEGRRKEPKRRVQESEGGYSEPTEDVTDTESVRHERGREWQRYEVDKWNPGKDQPDNRYTLRGGTEPSITHPAGDARDTSSNGSNGRGGAITTADGTT